MKMMRKQDRTCIFLHATHKIAQCCYWLGVFESLKSNAFKAWDAPYVLAAVSLGTVAISEPFKAHH
ncbi:hypothetical protein C0081_03545 [Cohaesibacter celericrescens]|uniref:Uncharacterized protein n=1 Tax=Cohaesibacter celericrescens TaxID=2067669 RepID=A0A2N5XW56_9HYPH|nr:hypothetical protein C0081_03545 [Cohaesibacter celericrescens]